MIALPDSSPAFSKRSAVPSNPGPTRHRSTQLAAHDIHFVPHPKFDRPDAEAWLESLRPPRRRPKRIACAAERRLPAYYAALYEVPLLSPEEETYLFCRMNYLKFKARRSQPTHSSAHHASRHSLRDERLRQATAIRNRIVQANLRLVVSVARTFATSAHPLDELIGEGHLPLIRAVELFDVSRGYRFSTYATYTLRNRFRRLRQDAFRKSQHVIAMESPLLEQYAKARDGAPELELAAQRKQETVARLLGNLSERERTVIEMRYGIDADVESPSFASIGRRIGLSKERVRQVALQAIAKLQDSLVTTDI